MKTIYILNGSPHIHGVSDTLLNSIHEELSTLPVTISMQKIREKTVYPCLGCRKCSPHPHICTLDIKNDDARSLLQGIKYADIVVFCAPIYFYTLPACTINLIDRAQCFFEEKKKSISPMLSTFILLHAARTRGEELFRGALLTLKYFFKALNREISELCLLRGLDTKDDILRDDKVMREIHTLCDTIKKNSQLVNP